MKICLVKNLSGQILPAYDQDKESLKRFKAGEIFMAEVTKPRNIKFHRKFFALLNMVIQNQEIYTDIEDLRHDITIEAGYYELRPNLYGEELKKPKSISFAKMDDLEFGEFYDKCLNVIVQYFHFDKEDIIQNIEQFY